MNRIKATRITVAHRLTTIKDADRIYVLQDGVIAEEGNYEALMELNGIFARLAKRQME
jgi:ATP-binding cassette subfamily C protein